MKEQNDSEIKATEIACKKLKQHNLCHYKKQGQPIFGYEWKDGQLMINEKEGEVRRFIYELFLKTKRKQTVANILNDRGYRTRQGGLFSHTTIARLLQDTTAKGMYPVTRKRIDKGTHNDGVETGGGNVSYLPCPAIISEELWQACHELLQKQSTSKKPGPQSMHLLSGYLYCSCGKSMYVRHRGKYPAFRCTACKTKILVDDIETIFHQQLHPFLLTNDGSIIRATKGEPHTNATSIYDTWPQLSFDNRRSIIEAITQKIIVFTSSIDIRFLQKPAMLPFIKAGKSEQFEKVNTILLKENEAGEYIKSGKSIYEL